MTSFAQRMQIEDLEHKALDPRSVEEWGHLSTCQPCRWERDKQLRRYAWETDLLLRTVSEIRQRQDQQTRQNLRGTDSASAS